jgi:hypothetical protein
MDNERLYNALVEMTAQARILAAMADGSVSKDAQTIKGYAARMAKSFGKSSGKFTDDTVERYQVLLAEYKAESGTRVERRFDVGLSLWVLKRFGRDGTQLGDTVHAETRSYALTVEAEWLAEGMAD